MLDLTLYSTARKLQTAYSTALRAKGFSLTFTQYLVLRELWDVRSLSEKELGQRLNLDSGTLTPVLKTLINLGYITKERSKKDERVVIASLTEEGTTLQEKVGILDIGLPEEKAGKLEELLLELNRVLSK